MAAVNFKYYLILHLTVFVWGFTGVLGDQIDLSADKITFFRIGIALVSLIIIRFFVPSKQPISPQQKGKLMLTGVIVAVHWFAFFHAIKISTVSVGVVCMSSSTLFTAILEPLILKRPYLLSEFMLSLVIVFGVVLIIGFEPHYIAGILVGLSSAFLASLFNVLNAQYIRSLPPLSITQYEMAGGLIAAGLFLLFTGQINATLFHLPITDWVFLLILGLVCTTVAFMVSVWIMQYLTAFTVSLSINMEPVYAILIALFIACLQGETNEQMSVGFYIGTFIIIAAVFVNAYLKKKKKAG